MTENYFVLLGTKGGPAIRPGSAMPSSNLLCLDGQYAVIDCGLGVTKALVDQGFELKNISLIFISHLHSDHYIELGSLIHTAWTAGLKTKLKIWGPAGLDQYWQGFLQSMQADIELRIDDEGRPDLRALVEIKTIEVGTFMHCDQFSVSAIRTLHPPLIDCFAFSFNSASKHVVYSGDTAPFAQMQRFAAHADLLVHEAMLEAGLEALFKRVGNGSDKLMQHFYRSHSFVEDVAALAKTAQVKQLALTHLIPADDPSFTVEHWQQAVEKQWHGRLHVGYDGLRIEI